MHGRVILSCSAIHAADPTVPPHYRCVTHASLLCLLTLLQVVRDAGDTAPCLTVNIDTLTFDRVLIFLEASALDKEPPQFALQHLPALTQVGCVHWSGTAAC